MSMEADPPGTASCPMASCRPRHGASVFTGEPGGRSMTDTTDPAATAENAATAEARRDDLAGRLMAAALGALEMQAVYLGDRLGLYRSLAEEGPATPAELAERAGIHPRYAREWLEHQAVGAILDVDDTAADPDARRYMLPDGHAAV